MIFVYLILLATSLLFYIQFEGPFSFYLFCFVASYPIIFGSITFYIKHKLFVTFESNETEAPKGSKAPVKLTVDNPTRFPIPNCDITVKYFSEIDSQVQTFTIHTPVFPRNKQELTIGVTYSHYGSVSLQITKVRVFDMLRLFKMKAKLKNSLTHTKLTVFPNLIPLENNIGDYSELGLEADSYSKVKKGDDPSEVFDIHEYNEGDKISRIHWKLSAKQDEIMVKDYSLPIMNGVLLAIDTSTADGSAPELDSYDTIIDAASAISFHLAENGMTHTVMWSSENNEGYSSEKVSDIDGYMLCVVKMVKNNVGKQMLSIPQVLTSLSDGERKFAHLILCTSSFTENDIRSLLNSEYAYRYTVLDASRNSREDYTDGELTYISVTSASLAEKIDELTL